MFGLFKRWRARRREAAYLRGFDYAAGQLLWFAGNGFEMGRIDAEARGELDLGEGSGRHPFNQGMQAAMAQYQRVLGSPAQMLCMWAPYHPGRAAGPRVVPFS